MGKISMRFAAACAFLLPILFISNPVFAQDITDVSENIVASGALLPGFIAGLSYLLGLLFAVQGVLKLKDHVENPGQGSGQTPIRTPMIRLFIGGAFFSLPIVTQTLYNSFTGGLDDPMFDPTNTVEFVSSILGSIASFVPTLDLNDVLANITNSLQGVPGLIAAFAYLLGLSMVVAGLIKLKEHVESPEQTTLKEPIARLLTAGALFALPTIYTAMYVSIDGPEDGGILSAIGDFLGGVDLFYSGYGQSACNPAASTINSISSTASTLSGGAIGSFGSTSVGQLMCGILLHTGVFPAFLTAIAYLFGLVMGIWGILKIRDHVLNPQQNDIMQGVSRLLAGGAFFALPVVIEVFRNTLSNTGLSASSLVPVGEYNDGGSGFFAGIWSSLGLGSGACGSAGLEGMLICFASDVLGPLHILLNFFCLVAGIIFLMIGISRLIKTAQDGAKGPGGLGTMMTFLTGGALISYNELIRAFTTTLTGDPLTKTYATIKYSETTGGLTDQESAAAHMVITAILKFMIIVGLLSFVRGIFIVRSVAEGNQQASMMAAVTHLVAGTLAINLGPFLNAVQTTLGISDYGIVFSASGTGGGIVGAALSVAGG